MAKAVQQVELARLSWEMQDVQNCHESLASASSDEELARLRIYNQAMREFYEVYVKIIGKVDVEGWEKFALFVLGYKPDLDLSIPEGEVHATDRS